MTAVHAAHEHASLAKGMKATESALGAHRYRLQVAFKACAVTSRGPPGQRLGLAVEALLGTSSYSQHEPLEFAFSFISPIKVC